VYRQVARRMRTQGRVVECLRAQSGGEPNTASKQFTSPIRWPSIAADPELYGLESGACASTLLHTPQAASIGTRERRWHWARCQFEITLEGGCRGECRRTQPLHTARRRQQSWARVYTCSFIRCGYRSRYQNAFQSSDQAEGDASKLKDCALRGAHCSDRYHARGRASRRVSSRAATAHDAHRWKSRSRVCTCSRARFGYIWRRQNAFQYSVEGRWRRKQGGGFCVLRTDARGAAHTSALCRCDESILWHSVT